MLYKHNKSVIKVTQNILQKKEAIWIIFFQIL